MALLHQSGQVGADVVALECHACGARYSGDDLEVILDLGTDCALRCLDPQCGAGGMIAHRKSRVEERFPAPLSTRYTPIPDALADHREALGLKFNDLLVVWSLERHRRAMGDEVWPEYETLHKLTGLSVSTIKRVTNKMVDANLIGRRRVRKRNGQLSSNRYDLDPLWQRVAELEQSTTGQGEPWIPPKSPPDPATGQPDPWTTGQKSTPPQVTVSREVDVLEADPFFEGEPVGTSPARPDIAAARQHLQASRQRRQQQRRAPDEVPF